VGRAIVGVVVALLGASCESSPPPPPDFAGHVSYDLGERLDLPPPFGFDGNFLPVPDPAATLVFSITDADDGLLLPSRVIFRPSPGSGFGDSLTDPSIKLQPGGPPGGRTGATIGPGVVGEPEGVLLQIGYGEVHVPPGEYDLVITRGPEYEIVEVHLVLAAGVVQAVNAELTRSVDTRGWLAADMHIHSALSFDSRVPIDRRAISMVTNGIEVLVPTEHHGSYDYRDLLVELGYDRHVAGSVAGNELNFKEGHAGVFPVPYDRLAKDGGSPPYQNLNSMLRCDEPRVGTNCYTAAEAFPIMRALHPGGSLVTVNHPWFGQSDLGYFTNIGWGQGTNGVFPAPLPTAGLFDAIEVLNGYWTEPHAESYLVADWFYLLSQGLRIAALGNSDTHGMHYVRAGWPRSWLRLPIDAPGDLTDDLLRDAIKHQRVIASTGPFVTIEIEGAQIGDTVKPFLAQKTRVKIVADAPSWMALDEIFLFVNGRELGRYNVPGGQRPRFSAVADVPLSGDAFVVVLATGYEPMAGDIVGEQAEVAGGHTLPWAITNPIYVDANGDGQLHFDAPTDGTLPWVPSAKSTGLFGQGAQPQSLPSRSGPIGAGSGRPAGRDCDPSPMEHPRLDAMSDLLHDAVPLLY